MLQRTARSDQKSFQMSYICFVFISSTGITNRSIWRIFKNQKLSSKWKRITKIDTVKVSMRRGTMNRKERIESAVGRGRVMRGLMKFDRRMNITTLQSPSTKRPEASVRLVILCLSAQCSHPDQLEGRQFRRRGIEQISVKVCVCVCLWAHMVEDCRYIYIDR